MANNNITLVKDVKVYRRNTTVKVKIASLWKLKMNGTEDETFRVDMILMDEKENFIYCTCFHKVLKDFQKFLFVDNTIMITNPTVSKDANPRYVEHDHKIAINGKSTVSTCTNWEGPKFGFKFANFKDVLQNKYKEKAFIDFIGYVQVCNDLGMVTKRNGVDTPKINFKLRDLDGVEIHANLWEHNAVALSNFMNDKNRDKHVFIIVQFGAVNKYQGKMGLTNNYEAARIFLNADVEEMISFRKQYFENFLGNESSDSSNTISGSLVISSMEEKFLHKCGFILARYISSMSMAKEVILVGTITEISNEMLWFRILLKVKDCSSTTTLTLFDSDAKKIFGKTAQQLVQEEEQFINNGQVPPEYPKEFEKLIGEKYGFIIKVSEYNIAHQIEQYSISMLTQDKDILSAVYKKFDIQKLEERYFVEENCFSDVQSTNEIKSKDEVDCVQESAHDEDVCEIEGPISSRIRKRRKLDDKHSEDGSDKVKLLTPKIEKD